MKSGRRQRKITAWVNVATADTGVETERKGAIPVAIKYQHVTNTHFFQVNYLDREIGCTFPL